MKVIKSQELPFFEHPDAPKIQKIFQILENQGFEVRIVGGAVRDWLLGETPKDIDLGTSASPDQIEKIFPQTKPIGKAFGVMLVILEGKGFELATFREEGNYQDGRRPGQITLSTPEKDAARRDFTINGLFYHPGQKKLWDFVGGLKDLESKTLQTIGNPEERFQEDHLRILRAYRFQAQLGLTMAPNLRAAVKTQSELLASVSRERIREEMLKLMDADFRAEVIEQIVQDQVMVSLFPKVDWSARHWQPWQGGGLYPGLFELALWCHQSGGRDQDLNLRLSQEQTQAVANALWFHTQSREILKARPGVLIERFWEPSFLAGFRHWRKLVKDAKELEWVEKAYEAFCLWGPEKPKAQYRAADFPELSGQPLGQKLKECWLIQLEQKLKKDP